MTEPGRPVGPLDGQVALVTGASSGLGRATAVALAQAGADVALLARGRGDLEQAAAEVGQVGGRALVLVADLAGEEELTRAVARVLDAFGRIDVLVNAAGTDAPGPVAAVVAGRAGTTRAERPPAQTTRSQVLGRDRGHGVPLVVRQVGQLGLNRSM